MKNKKAQINSDSVILTLEGRVLCDSGKLLIVDPCCLSGFDFEEYEAYVKEFEKRESEILESQIARSKEIVKGPQKKVKLEKKQKEFHERFLAPPKVAQADNYVYFFNGIDCGIFPVIKRPRSYHLIFHPPINSRGHTYQTRLDGKLIGHLVVNSASQIITDALSTRALSKINPETNRREYCVLNVEKGYYKVRFIRKNEEGYDRLSITREGSANRWLKEQDQPPKRTPERARQKPGYMLTPRYILEGSKKGTEKIIGPGIGGAGVNM